MSPEKLHGSWQQVLLHRGFYGS